MMHFQWQGLDESLTYLDILPDNVREKAIKPALRDIAFIVKREAKANLAKRKHPYAIGYLEKYVSIVSLRPKRGMPTTVIVGIPRKSKISPDPKKHGRKPFYWMFLERGTRFMKPRPWLRPAFESAQPKMQPILIGYLKKFVESRQHKKFYEGLQ